MVLLRKPAALGTMPQKSVSPISESMRGDQSKRKKCARILVVDDDPLLANGLARNIRNMGHEAVKSDGANALKEYGEWEFDLVITDLDMPFVDGMELTRRIRELSPGARVVIYTANESVSDEELLEAGAREVLRKPAEVEALKDCIRRNLR